MDPGQAIEAKLMGFLPHAPLPRLIILSTTDLIYANSGIFNIFAPLPHSCGD